MIKRLASNVVDEGSGINRCWSSSDAEGREQSVSFLVFLVNSTQWMQDHPKGLLIILLIV